MAQKEATKPNILIIWDDDIGWFNISAYNHGIMGYRTPNIDRVAGCRRTRRMTNVKIDWQFVLLPT
jgi:arylsulfatase A-like enzyme